MHIVARREKGMDMAEEPPAAIVHGVLEFSLDDDAGFCMLVQQNCETG
jgi:hypothetical protein